MLQNERYSLIYNILQEKGNVSTQYLQKRLFASEATIRRDLEAMEKQGLLKRVWGGAMLETVEKDIPSFVRQKANQDKKEKICETASAFLKNSMTIFTDSSTTCLPLIPYIGQLKDVTVITSSLKMSKLLSDYTSATVHVLGGQVYEDFILSGHVAVRNVKEYHTDLLFFSCSGISATQGITSIEPRVIEVVRAMMERTEKKILLCDTSKINKAAPLTLCSLWTPDHVVMDEMPCEESGLSGILGKRLIV